MKKFLSILILVAVVFFCGCDKIASVNDSAYIYASFNISMDDGLTKATADGDGAAANVNRCIMQIWKGNEIYKTVVKTAPAGTREYKFEKVTLYLGDTYDFLFWADCGTEDGADLYYSTESLKNVRMLHPERGNDDAVDAFCNRILGCRIDSEYTARLILRRPLAQLNIITKDLPVIAGMTLAKEFAPKSISYNYCGCTDFDVSQGRTVSESVFVAIEDTTVYGKVGDDGSCTLAMAYFFPQDGESVSAVGIKVRSENGAVMAVSCDNVPFRTNYRTNIIGSMMTAKGGFSVYLSPIFDGEINVW